MNTTITTSSMPMVMTSASSLTIKSAASTASEIFDKYEMNELLHFLCILLNVYTE